MKIQILVSDVNKQVHLSDALVIDDNTLASTRESLSEVVLGKTNTFSIDVGGNERVFVTRNVVYAEIIVLSE